MGQSALSSYDNPQSQITTKVLTFYSEQEGQQQYQRFKDLLSRQPLYHVPCAWIHFEHLIHRKQWKIIIGLKYPDISLRKDFLSRKKTRAFYIEQQLKEILCVIACFLNQYQEIICCHLDILSHIFLWRKDNGKLGLMMCNPQLLYGLCQRLQCQRSQSKFDKSWSFQKLKAKAIEQIFSLFMLEKIVLPNQSNVEQINFLYHNKWHVNLVQELIHMTSYQFGAKINEISNCLSEQLAKIKKQEQIVILKDVQEKQIRAFPTTSCKFKKSKKNNQISEELVPLFKNNLRDYNRDVSESIVFSDSLELPQSPQKQINSIAISEIDWINQEPDSRSEEDSDNIPRIQLNSSINQWQDIILQDQKQSEENQDSNKINKSKKQQKEETFKQRGFQSGYLFQLEDKEVTIQLEEGSCYQGFMREGKKQGKGRLYFCDGGHYDGEWKQDEMHGFGELYYSSGRLAYRGHWKQGQFHGLGIIYNQIPQDIEGSFDYTDFSHVGMKWLRYNGTFYEDKKHGQGQLFLSNGEKFQGIWKQNEVQGRGKFLTLSRQLIHGIWVGNVLHHQQARQFLQPPQNISQE